MARLVQIFVVVLFTGTTSGLGHRCIPAWGSGNWNRMLALVLRLVGPHRGVGLNRVLYDPPSSPYLPTLYTYLCLEWNSVSRRNR
jgi:hypothetical protein